MVYWYVSVKHLAFLIGMLTKHPSPGPKITLERDNLTEHQKIAIIDEGLQIEGLGRVEGDGEGVKGPGDMGILG